MWETFIVLNTRNRWESNCRSGAANFTRWRAHAIFNTVLPEWRNWQTQQTQNLPGITPRVGSTPSSGTKILKRLLDCLSRQVRRVRDGDYTSITLDVVLLELVESFAQVLWRKMRVVAAAGSGAAPRTKTRTQPLGHRKRRKDSPPLSRRVRYREGTCCHKPRLSSLCASSSATRAR